MTMHFKIDEEGFIKLLRRDIYNRSDVYLRELLQNAFDSQAKSVKICLHVCNGDDEIVALSCCDNGLGMTKLGIQDQFLNLCKRHQPNENILYRRFGIGVFTYLAFCQEIHVSTKSKGGKAWYLKILGKDIIQSLDDIVIDDLVESDQENIGTSIYLVLKKNTKIQNILPSFQYWIRDELPASVNVCVSQAISPRPENISSLLIQSREESVHQYDITPKKYPSGSHVLRGLPIVKSGFLRVDHYSQGIAVCEGGILIEDDMSDLTPKEISDIPFSGLINVLPGLLDLDAGRSRIRRESSVFVNLRRSLASRFSSALSTYIKSGRHLLKVSNFKEAEIIRRALRSTSDPVELLKEWEDSIFFHVLGYGEISLKRIAITSKSSAIYFYSGDSWYWIVSMGDLKGHDTNINVTMKSNAGVVSSSGNTVFILPEKKTEGKIIDENVLKKYFSRFYGKILKSLSVYSSPVSMRGGFPDYWRRKVSIPSKLSLVATAVSGALFFDSDGNAFLSKNERVVRAIDSYLKKADEVPVTTKYIIETYLNLLSGKISSTVSDIESAVMSAIQPKPKKRRISIREVIDEIER